jgi:hypothetical protein
MRRAYMRFVVQHCYSHKTMFGSSLPQLFVGGFVSYLPYLCLLAYSGVQHFCLVFFRLVARFSGLSIFDCMSLRCSLTYSHLIMRSIGLYSLK